MFGGFGGALKNLTGKAEEALEKTKKDIEGLAIEKKQKATELLEQQAKKTGEALLQGKSEIEKTAVGVASDAKKTAIEGFDKEVANAEQKVDEAVKETAKEDQAAPEKAQDQPAPADSAGALAGALGGLGALGALGNVDKEINSTIDGAVKEVSHAVDEKMKEADQLVDKKRDEVVKQVQGNIASATASAGDQVGSVLGKAKGLLKF